MRNMMWRVTIGVVCGFLLLGCDGASDSSSALADPAGEAANEGDSSDGDLDSDAQSENSTDVMEEGDESAAVDAGVSPEDECPAPDGIRPAALGEMAGIFDGSRLIFFGGDQGFPIQCSSNPDPIGNTWIYDSSCNFWHLLYDQEMGPGPRTRSLAVYDEQEHRMLVFGGRYKAKGESGDYEIYNETWALDLTGLTWSQLSTTGQLPSARWATAGIYDPVRHQMVVTTGNVGPSGLTYAPIADTYVLDLNTLTWTERPHGDGPAARLFASATYDAARDAMVLFAGNTAFFGPMLNDLWTYDLESHEWSMTSMGVATAPEPRFAPSLIYDEEMDRYVVFGGHDNGTLGNRNDIWIFSPNDVFWGKVTPGDELNPQAPEPGFCDFPVNFVNMQEDSPERRSMQLMVNSSDGSALLTGGKTDCGIVDDVWSLTLKDFVWEVLQDPTVGISCERAGIEGCDAFCF